MAGLPNIGPVDTVLVGVEGNATALVVVGVTSTGLLNGALVVGVVGGNGGVIIAEEVMTVESEDTG